jgi:hypothetical protein
MEYSLYRMTGKKIDAHVTAVWIYQNKWKSCYMTNEKYVKYNRRTCDKMKLDGSMVVEMNRREILHMNTSSQWLKEML